MNPIIVKFIKDAAKAIAIVIALISVYLLLLSSEVRNVDKFCSEMIPGLDVNQIHVIAENTGVGFRDVRDPNAVKNQTLGIKIKEKANTWFFSVGAPMTFGEHSCDVYHDYHVVLSARQSR